METMSAQEFADRVDEILLGCNMTGQRWQEPLPGTHQYWNPDAPVPKSANGLLVQWATGGATGGNCWNNNGPKAYATGNEPEELTALDAVVDKLCPDITRRAFRQVERLVETGSYTEEEHYGNHTSHQFRFVSLDKLYEMLVEHNLIATPEPPCAPR